jgi:hypothetical protein
MASIGGKENLPLSEDDIINKLILPGKLSLEVFANADISLVTPKIQAAYVNKYGIDVLLKFIHIMQNVNQFYLARGIFKYMMASGLSSMVNTFLEMIPPRKVKYYTEQQPVQA